MRENKLKAKHAKAKREFNPEFKARIKARTDSIKDFKEKYKDEITKAEIGIAGGLILELGKKAIKSKST